MGFEPDSTSDAGSRIDRAQRVVRELQQRGEARTRRLRQMAERSIRTRRELVRLVRKEIRHRMNVGREGPPTDVPADVPGSPSSSKS